jgi:hypothetical protein
MTMMSFVMMNPWVPQCVDVEIPSCDIVGNEAQVYEYAVDGGAGAFRGFSAFVQIWAPLTKHPRVEGFLATYRNADGMEVRLTRKDLEKIEVNQAQDLELDGEGSPCTAIILYLRIGAATAVQKLVIYPENELAELLARHDAPIGRMYGHYDSVPPHRFHRDSHAA